MTFFESWDKTGQDRLFCNEKFVFGNFSLFDVALIGPRPHSESAVKTSASVEFYVPNNPLNMCHNDALATFYMAQ